MIQKKVCMIGAFSVGKTSLVRRWVSGIYSERYLSTVGVKIDRRVTTLDSRDLTVLLWDLAGEDEFHSLRTSYLRGASGYVLVVDGTRPRTLDTALRLQRLAETALGPVPFTLALNKHDLVDQWRVEQAAIASIEAQGWSLVRCSAKTGETVGTLFSELAHRMIGVSLPHVGR